MELPSNVIDRMSELAARLRLDPARLPDLVPNSEARPFVFVAADGTLHWRVVERDRVVADRVTSDPDELLYWTFGAITASLGTDWELAHRTAGEDNRRGRWSRQQELLHALDPRWARRWRAELTAELAATGAGDALAALPEPLS